MPQRLSPEVKGTNSMITAFKVVAYIALLLTFFAAGYYANTKGFRVVNADGASVVKSNAAQTVKDENARLGREIINKTEEEAETILRVAGRTFFVGIRDGKVLEYKGQKTFTNMTVEVKDGKVVKTLGWY